MTARLDVARGVVVTTRAEPRAWSSSSRGRQRGVAHVRVETAVDVPALREAYAERAAIREFDGGEPRAVAEREAWEATLAAILRRIERGG